VAWYGEEEDAGTEMKEVEKCAVCAVRDPFKKDNSRTPSCGWFST
jgi:hypothetical protein